MRIVFPHVERPRVSILIVAWHQHAHLEACLRAVQDAATRSIPFEVILVLNGATREVQSVVESRTSGLRVVRSQVNLGFAGGNNRAAAIARGEYLVLLNDDAVVQTGWLDWLVATADASPNAGVVGSCILFPDGRMQEAGSLIWNDGSTMPAGRADDPGSLAWHFVRRVDYVSACSALVRRSLWDKVGGLDEGYFPAYYEDVDFCLAAHAAGSDVLYEPRSRVSHYESASSATDYKSFLFARNKARLKEKWAEALDAKETAAPWSPAAVRRALWRVQGCPRRIFVVDDCVPDRAMGSGFGRMFDALLELAACGHALALHPTVGVTAPHDALVSAGVAIVAEPPAAHLSRPEVFYDAVIVSRPHNFDRVAPFVRAHQPWAALIYDAEALYWRRLGRQMTLLSDEAAIAELRRSLVAVRVTEERIFRESDYAVVVSHEEAEVIREIDGHCPFDVLLPSEPDIVPTTRRFADRRGIAFVAGWMAGAQSPNGDGLRWFIEAVLPRIRAKLPWVRLHVTGGGAPAELVALAGPNVRFEGRIESLRDFYDRVRVVISPLRYGAGVKLKTVEALQYGVPVVSTTVGAEGIDFRGLPAVDIADDAVLYADRVLALLTLATEWQARRNAIDELVRGWQNPSLLQTWTGALERAFQNDRRGENTVFVHH